MSFNPEKLNIHDLTIEEPEKKEFEGRDPEKFLDEVFDWIEENVPDLIFDRNAWHYEISRDNKFVNMDLGKKTSLPEHFYDDVKKVDFKWIANKTGSGIGNLKLFLRNEKIASIKNEGDGGWYIEVIVEGEKKIKLEVPEVPESRNF